MRMFLPNLTCLLAIVFAISCGDGSGMPVSDPEPSKNLLIVCIDTLRADHVGSYGYRRPTTPRIDSLASQGTLFLNAKAHSGWTVPSTATLLTSVLPSEHGAVVGGDIKNLSRENLPLQIREEVPTLAEILKQAGFRTGLFSANVLLSERFKRGFDVAEGRPLEHATGLTNKAISWISQGSSEPLFLYFQYMDIHHPIQPPEPYFSYFKVADGSKRGERHKGWAFARLTDWSSLEFRSFRNHKIALYDGALRFVDSEIERFLDFLEERGILADTLVVITSDHGEEFWDHAEVERELGGDPRDIWGIGHGHSLFEELLRVPLVFWGRQIAQGSRIDCEIGQLDVAPTVLEFLAVDKPPNMKGRSLAKLISQRSTADKCVEVPIIAEAIAYGLDAKAVVWKGRKLIQRSDGLSLLYDLRFDPREKHNLAGDAPEITAGLRSLLAKHTETGEQLGEQMPSNEETTKQLRALGYIE